MNASVDNYLTYLETTFFQLVKVSNKNFPLKTAKNIYDKRNNNITIGHHKLSARTAGLWFDHHRPAMRAESLRWPIVKLLSLSCISLLERRQEGISFLVRILKIAGLIDLVTWLVITYSYLSQRDQLLFQSIIFVFALIIQLLVLVNLWLKYKIPPFIAMAS